MPYRIEFDLPFGKMVAELVAEVEAEEPWSTYTALNPSASMSFYRGLPAALCLVALAAPSVSAQQVRSTRPGGELEPTVVSVSFFVVDLQAVDDVDESFSMDFVLRAQWKDERLAWAADEGDETSSLLYELQEVWHPQLLLVNERDLQRMLPVVAEVTRDGTVTLTQRYQGELSTELALRDFPSDLQRLPVELVAARSSPAEVEFVVDADATGMLESARLSGWEIGVGEWTVDSMQAIRLHAPISRVIFRVEAQRQIGYFLWTMMLPLSLIVFMAYTVFWIDPNFLPSQVGVSTAAMFSMIAYRTALRLALPRVSYVTKADIFILGSTILVFAALAHAIATGRLAKTGREDLAKLLKKWARRAYPLLFGLILLLAIWW